MEICFACPLTSLISSDINVDDIFLVKLHYFKVSLDRTGIYKYDSLAKAGSTEKRGKECLMLPIAVRMDIEKFPRRQ